MNRICRKSGHDHPWRQNQDDLERDRPVALFVVRTACRRCGEVLNVYVVQELLVKVQP